MHGTSMLLALAGSVTSAMAAAQGFNYGSTFTTGAAKQQSDFESEFKTAQALSGAPGTFNSARLYTMIQGGTTNDVISAIPAAISTKTTLLLGLWASAGDAIFANELQALKTAISQYGSSFGSSVVGISVGSEDLYRITPTGLKNDGDPGASPATLVDYIGQVKEVLSDAGISVPVGHVDTWNAWVNSTVTPVIDAADFIGIDTYPYFQNTQDNSIGNAKVLFDDAVSATRAVVSGKPIWITETGWPVSGKTENLAVASTENAKAFWDAVGCGELFGNTNTWWYTLQDALPATPNPSFGLLGSSSTSPLFDLSCKNVSSASSSSAASSSTASSSAAASGSATAATTTTTGLVGSSLSSAAATSLATAGGGGSPALSSGLGSSQLSLESKTVTATSSASGAAGTGSSGSGSPNGTIIPASSATPTPSLTPASSGSSSAASLGAGLLAVFAAMLAL